MVKLTIIDIKQFTKYDDEGFQVNNDWIQYKKLIHMILYTIILFFQLFFPNMGLENLHITSFFPTVGCETL